MAAAASSLAHPSSTAPDRSGGRSAAGRLAEIVASRIDTFDPARLPQLSPLAARLARIQVSEATSAREFRRLIEHDPVLVARLVGLANSVAFGAPGKHANTLEQALLRVGLQQSAQICFALLCSQAIGHAIPPRWRSALWVHALCTAASATRIARALGTCDPNDAYLGGLIYDIGLMALECLQVGTLDTLAAAAEAEGRLLHEVEDALAGEARDHLARELLASWSMPAPIIDAVSRRSPSPIQRDSMSAVLWCADHLAHSRRLVEGIYLDEEPPLPLSICTEETLPATFFSTCSLDPDEAVKIEAQVANQVQALRAMASMCAQIRPPG